MALPVALILANFLVAPSSERDVVYQGALVVAQLVQALIFIAYCVVAAVGSRRSPREVLALRRPDWRAAARFGAAALVAIVVLNLVLERFTHAGEDQGITPTRPPHGDEWAVLAVAFVVFALVVPLSEELLFRGLAFAAFGRYAVPLSAALFALAHRLPELLLPVFVAGLLLAELRRRTESVLPGFAVHAAINALGLALAVATSL
jgi:membrane protease YdiL (CAAX protease family)